MDELERKKRFLINAAYLFTAGLIYYVIVHYVIYALMPFTIALIVTLILKRPADAVSRLLHIPRKGVAVVLVILFYGLIGALLTHALIGLAASALGWFSELPAVYAEHIEPLLRRGLDFYEQTIANIDPAHTSQVEATINNVLGKLTNGVALISGKFVGYAQSLAFNTPKFLISLIFCVVSTVFISVDYSKVSYFFLAQFSEKNQQNIIESKNHILGVISGLIRSYGLIMFITWCELSIGLKLIGLEDFMAVAFLIAIFDILPALGTGGIMIPWVLIVLLQRNFPLAAKLAGLYIFITVVRNIIEPKIVGESIGLHPVLLLISIYVGGTALGPMGIIIMPFTLVVIKKLNDAGHISLFRSEYLGDKDKDFQRNYKTGTIVTHEDEERSKLRG